MIKRLKESIKKEQFGPSIFGLFLAPFYFARKGLFENISSLAKYINGRVLDVGCGQKPYEKLFNSSQYIGLELDTFENRKNKKADYFYDGKTFPFRNNEFDSIIVNEVFEHVFNPVEFLNEIYRVLKPGGTLLMTVPFVWDEHEQPNDFARYTSFGLRYILKKSGFEIIEYRKSIYDIRVIFQLLNSYIYKKIATKNVYANLAITIFFISPFNILGELLSKVLPRNEGLYLDSVILLRKK
ncbi:MAG: class I SAM-dependent methyltransferase [wastewater metagenome]|nr:class I SAM-dependent methyltransferase [Candidatus Loosdrechtia aerotolerans]